MRWFTSDIHFDHKNILKFCPETRKFADVDEMNETIIQRYNNTVSDDDEVFILGDVGFDRIRAIDHLRRLKGKKYLIVGNHDHHMLNELAVRGNLNIFAGIWDYLEIKDAKRHLVLFHFPIHEWNKMHYGSIHLHGHTHGAVKIEGNAFDVGVDSILFDNHLPGVPYSEDQLVSLFKKENIRGHHGKGNL